MRLIAASLAFACLASAQGWQYTVGDSGFTSLSYNSETFLADYSAILIYSAVWDTGSESVGSCSASSGASYFQVDCDQSSPKHIRLRVLVGGAGTNTLSLTVSLSNLSTEGRRLLSLHMWQVTAIKWPSGVSNFPDAGGWNNTHPRSETPAILSTWSSGRLAQYMDAYNPTGMGLGWVESVDRVLLSLKAVEGQAYSLGSGDTDTATLFITMGGPDDSIESLAGIGIAAYRELYQQTIKDEDRRIICAHWISEKSKQSAVNPRGFLWDEAFDVSDSSAFKAALLARIDSLVEHCKAHGGQGVVIWDLEGQEFYHPMTYIGSGGLYYQTGGSWLALGAPEMEAVVDGKPIVDSMFERITNSGLKAGVTLRPSTQEFGSGRPMGPCYAQGDFAGGSYIDLDGTPINRGFACELWPVTFNDATDKVECVNDCFGFANGQAVKFYTSTGTLPSALSMTATYYICDFDAQAKTYSVGAESSCLSYVSGLSGASGNIFQETWAGPIPHLAQHLEAWNYQQALENLSAKINYAKQRWGVTLFYVDTTMYMRNSAEDTPCSATSPSPHCRASQVITKELWRDLNSLHPDVLIMPENSDADPYTASFYSTNIWQWGRSVYKKLIYPDHYVAVHMNAGYLDYLADNRPAFVRNEIRDGMIYILSVFGPPTGSTNTATYVMQDVEALKPEIGTLSMTDTSSGATRVFTGSPSTVSKYNTIMRVAFKGDEGSFTGYEDTYCEKRATTRCWLNGVEQSTAALNLSGYTDYRIEYRAWGTGRLVSVGYGGSL